MLQTHKRYGALFGASNPSYSPTLTTLLNFDEQQFLGYNETLYHHFSENPALNQYIAPESIIYYDGPPGNYGINLRAKRIGYDFTGCGIRHLLDLKGETNIPVIEVENDFQRFVSDTPCMSRAVAIVNYNCLKGASDMSDTCDPHYIAILYEKRRDSHALYFYDTASTTPRENSYEAIFKINYPYIGSNIDNKELIDRNDENLGRLFKEKLFLFYPSKTRETQHGVAKHSYAIEDAILLNQREKYILTKQDHFSFHSNQRMSSAKFELDPPFFHNAALIKKKHMHQMMCYEEESYLSLKQSVTL